MIQKRNPAHRSVPRSSLRDAAVVGVAMVATAGLAQPVHAGGSDGGWRPPEKLLQADGAQVPGGCPIESPAGRFVFTARRPGGMGTQLDIFVNERPSPEEPLAPGNPLPMEISSSTANDFCPTPLPDGVLYFVSNRDADDDGCGSTDILVSVDNPATGYGEPRKLACHPHGPNTPGTELSPSIVEHRWGTFLFYSSDFEGGDQDIYVSVMRDGSFGPGYRLGWPINTEYDDKQPNVSQDGREMVFASSRASGDPGQSDIYYARRGFIFAPWRRATNLSRSVPFETVDADETRPALSWDGERLLYGSGGVWQSERRLRGWRR